MQRAWRNSTDPADLEDTTDSTNLADSTDSADSADSTDSADSADSTDWVNSVHATDSLVIFKRFPSFIYSDTKGFISSGRLSSELYLAEWLSTISRKERFISRYLQYRVLGDCVF